MNRKRLQVTDRDMESRVIEAWFVVSMVVLCVFVFILTLARIACTPAAHLVPASHPTESPYNLALVASSEQARASEAGELAAFYREMF